MDLIGLILSFAVGIGILVGIVIGLFVAIVITGTIPILIIYAIYKTASWILDGNW